MHVSTIPLSGPTDTRKPHLVGPELAYELAEIGLRGFNQYMNHTLPRELELDVGFREKWETRDHSRVTEGFNNWQKIVFAKQAGFTGEQFPISGGTRPLPGIDYSWSEMYESARFAEFLAHITEFGKSYMKRSRYTDIPDSFRAFVWVEVFQKGDSVKPGPRIQDAYVAGRFFAQVGRGFGAMLNFVDARGINPPFGKTYAYTMRRGSLLLHPPWNSYFTTPNMEETPIVCYAFLLYPANGTRLKWNDDATINFKVSESLTFEPE